jgi:hypothetical protein
MHKIFTRYLQIFFQYIQDTYIYMHLTPGARCTKYVDSGKICVYQFLYVFIILKVHICMYVHVSYVMCMYCIICIMCIS